MTESVHISCSGKAAVYQTEEETTYGDSMPVASVSFNNKSARIGFIQKVLAILTIQVITGFFLITLTAVNWHFNYWIHVNHLPLMLMSCCGFIMTVVLPISYGETRQKPYSIMLLLGYPLSLAFGIMVVATAYLDAEMELLFAWGYYSLVILGLLVYSIFSLHTTLEFEASKGLFTAACMLVYLYSVTCLTVSCAFASNHRLLCLTLVVFLECASKLHHLKEMTGGEYRLPITPQDYVRGALHAHIDIGYTCVQIVRKIRDFYYK